MKTRKYCQMYINGGPLPCAASHPFYGNVCAKTLAITWRRQESAVCEYGSGIIGNSKKSRKRSIYLAITCMYLWDKERSDGANIMRQKF